MSKKTRERTVLPEIVQNGSVKYKVLENIHSWRTPEGKKTVLLKAGEIVDLVRESGNMLTVRRKDGERFPVHESKAVVYLPF